MEFKNPRNHALSALFLLIVAGGLVFYFLRQKTAGTPPVASVITPEEVNIDGAEKTKEPEFETLPPASKGTAGAQLPAYAGESIYELGVDPKMAASIGTAVVEKYQKNLIAIAERLTENPRNYDDWLSVAYIKKLFNNYPGARDAWEYAKAVNPDGAVAHFNLGELYGYELGDPQKAEENYQSTLRLDPYNLDYYVGFANFYEDVLKSPEKAESIMLSAVGKIPDTEVNLWSEIGAFYRNQGKYEKALQYFEKALVNAHDPRIKEAVNGEIEHIRSRMSGN